MFLIGDGTQIEPLEKVSLKTSEADTLEYECWDLFKKYCDTIGVEIKQSKSDKEYIDFFIAKTIQDSILGVFIDEGVDIEFINDI